MSRLTHVLQKTLVFLKGKSSSSTHENGAAAQAFELINQLDEPQRTQLRKATEQALLAVHQRSGVDAAAMVAEAMEKS